MMELSDTQTASVSGGGLIELATLTGRVCGDTNCHRSYTT